ncbi:MAG: hypothetical protein IJ727_05275 [Treponema sp.]|nr:hypothetical protein [Treponema sp.]
MTEIDFLQSIKNLAVLFKRQADGKQPVTWKSATHRALYKIQSGMAADALWLSRKKVDLEESGAEGEWEDDAVSVEIAKTFLRLYDEKYQGFGGLNELIESAKAKMEV